VWNDFLMSALALGTLALGGAALLAAIVFFLQMPETADLETTSQEAATPKSRVCFWPMPRRQLAGRRRRASTFVPRFAAPPGPPTAFTLSLVIASPQAEQVTRGSNR
jgi:hypothetical protein